jgi:uncharacterized protein (TIGR03437 family)
VPVRAGLQETVRQAVVKPDDLMGVDALDGILKDPSQYYANVHTTDFRGGAMRGQLQRATYRVLMGRMSSDNETTPTTLPASGWAQVLAIATRDESGKLTSGEVNLTSTYTFPSVQTFSGFHIHPGGAGLAGPAVLGATLPAGLTSDTSGSGTLGPFYREVQMDSAIAVQTFENLFTNPEGDYINVHTTTNGGGIMRAQLRNTDAMAFNVMMSSANEPGPPPVTATAPSLVMVHTLRYEDGSVLAGTVLFDVNYRFPGATNFTAMHIHDGTPADNGPVRIPAPIPTAQLASDTGMGNYFVMSAAVVDGAALASLTDLVVNPENHYLNLHTQVSPGGAVRAQLAAANRAAPVVNAVISANQDKNATTVAPGELIAIYGTNLAKVGTNLNGWVGRSIPDSLNGAAVAIGAQRARLLYVSPTQIIAQVPFETAAGTQPLSVNNAIMPSAAVNVRVATAAPAIFFSGTDGAIVKNSDFSLVNAGNPVRAGDIILIYLTGLGQTTPALSSGLLVTDATARTSAVTATIGGKDADVISSIASPGFVGVYQVAVRVPEGIPAGNAQVVLKSGTATSNSVGIAVR